jgi:hypothetical protein
MPFRKGPTFEVGQRKCAVLDGSFRRRKNKKIRLLIELDKVHRRAPEASVDRRLFEVSGAESHHGAPCVINPLLAHGGTPCPGIVNHNPAGTEFVSHPLINR